MKENLIERIEEKEKDDYLQAKAVLEQIFSNNSPIFEKNPQYSHTDMRMSAFTHSHAMQVYNIELKFRTKLDANSSLMLKVEKLLNMRKSRTDNSEKLLYFNFVNGCYVFIFDIDDTHIRLSDIRSIKQKVTQYADDSEVKSIPTILLPVEQAIYVGKVEDGKIRRIK